MEKEIILSERESRTRSFTYIDISAQVYRVTTALPGQPVRIVQVQPSLHLRSTVSLHTRGAQRSAMGRDMRASHSAASAADSPDRSSSRTPHASGLPSRAMLPAAACVSAPFDTAPPLPYPHTRHCALPYARYYWGTRYHNLPTPNSPTCPSIRPAALVLVGPLPANGHRD